MAKYHTHIEHYKSMEINRKRKHKVRWNKTKLNETLKWYVVGINERMTIRWCDDEPVSPSWRQCGEQMM